MGRPFTYQDTSEHPATQLVPTLSSLLKSSISVSTMKAYERNFKRFVNFLNSYSLPLSLPIMPICVALYASKLFNDQYAASSIITALSPIAFMHKNQGLKDPVADPLVQRTLKGIKNARPISDTRLPISLGLLHRLYDTLHSTTTSPRERTMYQSMYLLAFYAFLRVGEFTLSHSESQNILNLDQIHMSSQSMIITFKQFKHSNGRTHSIVIHPQPNPYCPISAYQRYVRFRGHNPGPVYVDTNNKSVPREAFVAQFNKSLAFLKLSPQLYKSHSFRISAASYAISRGLSDQQIKHVGRWHSDAFLAYIRLG